MSENDLEKPVPDTAEQELPVDEDAGEPPEEAPGELPFDANEADAAEQHREVRLDEDEYR
jgi:hypothetical protein